MSAQDNTMPERFAAPRLEGSNGDYDEYAGALWQVYNDQNDEYDRTQFDTWSGDMDGILIFAGLFSASLTAFLVESYKLLKVDGKAGELTVALLTQISQQLANPDEAPASSEHFKPEASAIRVNIAWFLSLACSLTAALTATLVQQWSRRYLQETQRRESPVKRARIRTCLHRGVERARMSLIVESIPTLMHLALFLFFAGLIDFLKPLNSAVAFLIVAIIAICGVGYIFITLSATFSPSNPYFTPLSSLAWWALQALPFPCRRRVGGGTVSRDLALGREQLAMDMSDEFKERDVEALHRLTKTLARDSEFQPLVEGIPDFLKSSIGREVWKRLEFPAEAPVRRTGVDQDEQVTANIGMERRGEIVEPTAVPPEQQRDLEQGNQNTVNTNIGRRIVRLLETCAGFSSLKSSIRQSRAIACLDAIWAISTARMPSFNWKSYFGIELLRTVGSMRSADKETGIPTRAMCTRAALLHRVLQEPEVRAGSANAEGAVAENEADELDKALASADLARQEVERALWDACEVIHEAESGGGRATGETQKATEAAEIAPGDVMTVKNTAQEKQAIRKAESGGEHATGDTQKAAEAAEDAANLEAIRTAWRKAAKEAAREGLAVSRRFEHKLSAINTAMEEAEKALETVVKANDTAEETLADLCEQWQKFNRALYEANKLYLTFSPLDYLIQLTQPLSDHQGWTLEMSYGGSIEMGPALVLSRLRSLGWAEPLRLSNSEPIALPRLGRWDGDNFGLLERELREVWPILMLSELVMMWRAGTITAIVRDSNSDVKMMDKIRGLRKWARIALQRRRPQTKLSPCQHSLWLAKEIKEGNAVAYAMDDFIMQLWNLSIRGGDGIVLETLRVLTRVLPETARSTGQNTARSTDQNIGQNTARNTTQTTQNILRQLKIRVERGEKQKRLPLSVIESIKSALERELSLAPGSSHGDSQSRCTSQSSII